MKKVKSIKAEEAKVQVTEEQLKTIKGQQEELGGLLRDIGYLEISLEDGTCTPIEKESE